MPKMNTIPAGMPMITGQGRELEAGENMGAMGGFVSAKDKKKSVVELNNIVFGCFVLTIHI